MPRALKIATLMVATFFLAGLSGFLAMKFVVGGGAVKVPDLVGKDVKEAAQALEDQGLRLKVEEWDHHPLTPVDHIIRQRPEAYAMLKEDREVKVVVSRGRQQIYLPDLKGEKLPRARLILQQNGLFLQKIVEVHSERYLAGVVISQIPAPRQEVSTGTPVKLLVSRGRWQEGYYLPDFTGKHVDEVQKVASSFGLQPDPIEYEPSPRALPGTVIRQNPPPGSRVVLGEKIRFVVARGEAEVPETGQREEPVPFRYLQEEKR